jgi:hypothetical protein
MSPRQRAEAIMAISPRPACFNEAWWVEQITSAIQAAIKDLLASVVVGATMDGNVRVRVGDYEQVVEIRTAQQQALAAALEDLAAVTAERDGLADELRKTHKLLGETQERYEAALEEKRAELAKVTKERDELRAELDTCPDCEGEGYIESIGSDNYPESVRCEHKGLKAAELAAVARERDGLAAALATALHRMSCTVNHCKECYAYRLYSRPSDVLAAHDRAVAARVLRREAEGHFKDEGYSDLSVGVR